MNKFKNSHNDHSHFSQNWDEIYESNKFESNEADHSRIDLLSKSQKMSDANSDFQDQSTKNYERKLEAKVLGKNIDHWT